MSQKGAEVTGKMVHKSADLRSMKRINIKEDPGEGILLLGDFPGPVEQIFIERLTCAELLGARGPESCLKTLEWRV